MLELVGSRDAVCAIRCLGRDEKDFDLPPASAALTFAERLRCLREQALAATQRAIEASDRRCRRLRQDEPVWQHLQELAGHASQLAEQAEALQRRRQRPRRGRSRMSPEPRRTVRPASWWPPCRPGTASATMCWRAWTTSWPAWKSRSASASRN